MTKHLHHNSIRNTNRKIDLLAAFAYVSFAAMIFAAAFGKDILNFFFK